jgi:hypothetical protein
MIDRRTFLIASTAATTGLAHAQTLSLSSFEQPRFGQLDNTLMVLTPPPFTSPALESHAEILGDSDKSVAIMSSTATRARLTTNALSNQFLVFQLAKQASGSPIVLEPSSVDPLIETNTSTPDVAMDIKLLSFHLAENEPVKSDSRATLRLTVNRAEESMRGGNFETLYWAVTAGLNLWDDVKKRKAEDKKLNSDFKKALGNKLIEIPGGLGDIKLEIIKHKEPSWWKNVFQFARSDAGKSLVSALGFPAITNQVLRFVDEAASRFEKTSPEILFASNSLKFAFSKSARADFFSSGATKIGALNQGTWLMARGRDFRTLANIPAYYNGTFGRIVPADISTAEILDESYVDPFRNITYAVFGVAMKAYKYDFSID